MICPARAFVARCFVVHFCGTLQPRSFVVRSAPSTVEAIFTAGGVATAEVSNGACRIRISPLNHYEPPSSATEDEEGTADGVDDDGFADVARATALLTSDDERDAARLLAAALRRGGPLSHPAEQRRWLPTRKQVAVARRGARS